MLAMRTPNRFVRSRSMWNEIDRLFEGVLGSPNAAPTSNTAFPALRGWETEDAFFLEAELPGVRKEDLDLTLEGSRLTLKGARHIDFPEDSGAVRRERWSGEFERSLQVPSNIDGDGLQATFTGGVLQLTLPKAASARPRRIEIKG